MNYYNEWDKYAAEWIRELIRDKQIPGGIVDDRSITDVEPVDLAGFDQCHFFAGISGWSKALDLAGWNPTRPVWTASLPCQPFSNAGSRKGHEDERHLWPVFYRLVQECRPDLLVGEQVASKDGRDWLAAVFNDLELLGYACAGADLAAAGVGAPHIRQRLFWLAYSDSRRQPELSESDIERNECDALRCEPDGRMGNACESTRERNPGGVSGPQAQSGGEGCTDGNLSIGPADASNAGGWDDVIYVPCADGKHRPLPRIAESCPESLADGLLPPLVRRSDKSIPDATSEARVMRLKGYGNAICVDVAAVFLEAVQDVID